MTGRRRPNPATNRPHLIDSLGHEYRDQNQKDLDEDNNLKTVRVLTTNAVDSLDLVLLVNALGLDTELDTLAGTDLERHRRIAAARARLRLQDPVPPPVLMKKPTKKGK